MFGVSGMIYLYVERNLCPLVRIQWELEAKISGNQIQFRKMSNLSHPLHELDLATQFELC